VIDGSTRDRLAPTDTAADNLTRDQLAQLNRVIEIFGDPPSEEYVPPTIQVLEIARLWFLKRKEIVRKEGGHL